MRRRWRVETEWEGPSESDWGSGTHVPGATLNIRHWHRCDCVKFQLVLSLQKKEKIVTNFGCSLEPCRQWNHFAVVPFTLRRLQASLILRGSIKYSDVADYLLKKKHKTRGWLLINFQQQSCVITVSHRTHYTDYSVVVLLIMTLVFPSWGWLCRELRKKSIWLLFGCRKPLERLFQNEAQKLEQIMINSSTQDVAFNEQKHLRTRWYVTRDCGLGGNLRSVCCLESKTTPGGEKKIILEIKLMVFFFFFWHTF